MIGSLRKEKIKELLYQKRSVIVNDLARQFDVTTETIRNDLKSLESEDKAIKRSYGGAYLTSGVENLVDANIRMDIFIEAKKTIAKRCLPLINPGDTIFLDNSTTCYYIAQQIKDMHLTVLTNNVPMINLLSGAPHIKLVSVGGIYSATEKAFYGNIAIQTLENYFVDKVFFSSRFISIENGITDSTEQWTLIRRQALKHATNTYYVADHSKFNHTSYNRLASFSEIDALITDKPLDERWRELLNKYNCMLLDS